MKLISGYKLGYRPYTRYCSFDGSDIKSSSLLNFEYDMYFSRAWLACALEQKLW